MAMLSRAYAAFAAAFRGARKSDDGVTGVEYGVMFAVFGTGMLAAVAFLVSATTANYDASESRIAAAPIVCEADQFFDTEAGICVPKVQCSVTEWANPNNNTCEEAVTCASGFYADTTSNTCVANSVPGAPTDLRATIRDVSGSTVADLVWTAPAGTGGGITGYKIEQSTNSGGAWTVLVASQTAKTYTTGTLNTAVTPYWFRVSAISATGPGPVSGTAVVSFGAPSAPTITTITPAIVPTNVHQLTIAFTPPIYASSLTSYQYSLTGSGGPWLDLPSVDSTSPIVAASGLAANTEYLVSIRAIRVISPGNVLLGAPSASVRARTFGPAGPPRITEIRPSSGTLTVAFCAPQFDGTQTQTSCTSTAAITNYKYSTNGGTTWTAVSPASNASPITISGLTNGTSYSVRLRAVNAFGDGTPSTAVSSTPGTVPGAPTIAALSTAVVGGLAQITIPITVPGSTGGSAITSYQYSTDAGGTWTTRTTTAVTGTTRSMTISATSAGGITPLDFNTSYSVIVRAVNAIGPSVASNSRSITTLTGPPSAPTITGITTTSTSPVTLNVAFTAGADGGGSVTTWSWQYSTNNGTTWREGTPTRAATSFTTTQTSTGGSFSTGTSYTFLLRAVKNGVNGRTSAPFTVTPGSSTAKPTSLALVPGNQRLTATFRAPASVNPAITSYQYSTDDGLTWRTQSYTSNTSFTPPQITMVITRTSGTFALLTNGITYEVRVRAVNAVGPGAQSDPVNGKPCGPPGKPTAVAGALISTPVGIRVSWTAPSYTGGCAVSGYKIQWSSNGGTTWSAAKDDTASPLDVTKASPDNLTPGTTYVFRVAGENTGGIGAYSNVSASVTTPPIPATPNAPSAALTSSPDGIRVTWVPPSGSTVTNYVIERSANGGAYGNPVNDTASPLDIAAASLAPSTAYTFRVSAENDWGSSAFSNASSVVTTPNGPATPGAPGLNVSATVRQITVSWTALVPVPSGGYLVRQSTNGGTTWGAAVPVASGTSTVFNSGLTTGTTYTYSVAAVNAWGTGSYSGNTSATPSVPGVPVMRTPTAGNDQITVNWTNNASNTVDYTIQRTDPSGSATNPGTCPSWNATTVNDAATPYTWGALADQRWYCFQIRANNIWGNSGWSSSTGLIRTN